MSRVLILLVLVCIVLYVKYNLKYETSYEILQARPSQLTPDVFREKNPIVVPLPAGTTPSSLVKDALKYQHVYTTTARVAKDAAKRNDAKYVVISGASACSVDIINPKFGASPNYQSVDIRLTPDKALILPMYWRFIPTTHAVDCIYVHDLFSAVYQTFATLF